MMRFRLKSLGLCLIGTSIVLGEEKLKYNFD